MQEPKYPTRCVERFLEYVKIDTQSQDGQDSFPSTKKQFDLLHKLRDELNELGLDEVTLDENGYLFATIPATTKKKDVPCVGFLAHVDTSPETSGEGVKPIVHANYQGQDLVLPDLPSIVLRASEDLLLGQGEIEVGCTEQRLQQLEPVGAALLRVLELEGRRRCGARFGAVDLGEDLARDATRTADCWAEVRILEGKAVLEDVMIEGRSIRELAAEKE